jgi:peroxiredoxin
MDSRGQVRQPLKAGDARAVVLIFLMADCPVARATAPELARLTAEFGSRGVTFFGVYGTETAAEIAAFQESYRIPFPGLLDPRQQLARIAGATMVPEAVVFSPDNRLLYRGRIDDRAISLGTMRPEATRRDLRLALESVLSGQNVEPRFTEAVGCYLPEK